MSTHFHEIFSVGLIDLQQNLQLVTMDVVLDEKVRFPPSFPLQPPSYMAKTPPIPLRWLEV